MNKEEYKSALEEKRQLRRKIDADIQNLCDEYAKSVMEANGFEVGSKVTAYGKPYTVVGCRLDLRTEQHPVLLAIEDNDSTVFVISEPKLIEE